MPLSLCMALMRHGGDNKYLSSFPTASWHPLKVELLLAKDQIAGEMVAGEPIIEEDEAKKGAINKAKASVVEQIVKADDQVAKADEQVAEANE
ncbi:hypothetical protein L3X38_032735 [Prunus dulcis]|uniref:Uncharacterized protein n=1 Tax=Prunus dulcis TaxID=3755 RepID=A0AAD4YWX6_PRUDU|nr:hypothetical protein L3X38_032735 [Prunus dulcis]